MNSEKTKLNMRKYFLHSRERLVGDPIVAGLSEILMTGKKSQREVTQVKPHFKHSKQFEIPKLFQHFFKNRQS